MFIVGTGRGGTKSFEVVEILAIVMGGPKMFYPVLRGGAKSFGPTILPFCSPPLHLINDQSLKLIDITSLL